MAWPKRTTPAPPKAETLTDKMAGDLRNGLPKRRRTKETRAKMRVARQEQDPLKDYYTVAQAAEKLSLSVVTINAAIDRYKKGGHGLRTIQPDGYRGVRLIHHRELERWQRAKRPYHPPHEIPVQNTEEETS